VVVEVDKKLLAVVELVVLENLKTLLTHLLGLQVLWFQQHQFQLQHKVIQYKLEVEGLLVVLVELVVETLQFFQQ
jgi:hypothetical protein